MELQLLGVVVVRNLDRPEHLGAGAGVSEDVVVGGRQRHAEGPAGDVPGVVGDVQPQGDGGLAGGDLDLVGEIRGRVLVVAPEEPRRVVDLDGHGERPGGVPAPDQVEAGGVPFGDGGVRQDQGDAGQAGGEGIGDVHQRDAGRAGVADLVAAVARGLDLGLELPVGGLRHLVDVGHHAQGGGPAPPGEGDLPDPFGEVVAAGVRVVGFPCLHRHGERGGPAAVPGEIEGGEASLVDAGLGGGDGDG